MFATAGSDEKLALCRELGADLAINYRKDSFADVVNDATAGRGVDVAFDSVGGDTTYLGNIFVEDGVAGNLADPEPAGRQVGPRQARPRAVQMDGGQEVVLLVLQQRVVSQRAGGDHAGDVAADEALGRRGVPRSGMESPTPF